MPIVEPVRILFEGDAKDLERKVNALSRDIDKFAARTKTANQQMAQSTKTASMSWTDFRSAYSTVLDVVRVGQAVWQATGQEFVNYAEQVKNLSRNIGASAEETSRLIQVADDVRISVETLNIAMKEAQKDGITMSIEGLARLSNDYLKLAPGVERTQFLLDKFGKSGLEMGKLMERGGDGIRAMSRAINENLIMTEKGIKASEDYQKALDNFKDTLLGIQIAAGGGATTPMTNFFNNATDSLKVWTSNAEQAEIVWDRFSKISPEVAGGLEKVTERLKKMSPIFVLFNMLFGENTKATDDAEDSTSDFSGTLDDNSAALSDNKEAIKAADEALKEYKDMLDEVSRANQDAESFIQSYADSQRDYVKSHADAAKELQDAIASGDKEAIASAQQGIQELEASWHESTQRMIYDMVLAKVSIDGLTDAEFEATQDLAVQMGIRTDAEAETAKAAMETANAYVEGIEQSEDVLREKMETDAEVLALEEQKKLASGETTGVVLEGNNMQIESNYAVAASIDSATQSYYAMAKAAYEAASAASSIPSSGTSGGGSSGGGGAQYHSQDSGGHGVAGVPYMIGTGAQPEIFIPQTAGTFVPNADKKGIGTTYNINITNPKGETSENSIRKSLKNLSYLGYAA